MPQRQIGEEFVEKTKYRHLGPPEQMRGVPAPPLELPAEPSLGRIDLPDPAAFSPGNVDLRGLIERRRSLREYAPTPLSLAELGYLLWCTQGVTRVIGEASTLRTVPSAGARHAFETYVLANRVADLPSGLYRYLALSNKLLELSREPGLADDLVTACLGQDFVGSSAATFLWSAVVRRMTWRYAQRGYRYLHLDAGHVCQNLYLAAESIGCGACAVAAYDDDAVNAVLGLDGQEQFVIYLAAVGKRS